MKFKLGLIILFVITSLSLHGFPGPVCSRSYAEDSKEVLILKRDLAQERVARLQAQLTILQQQFAEGQKYLQEVQKELKELDGKLKLLEPKKEEKPKVEEKKK